MSTTKKRFDWQLLVIIIALAISNGTNSWTNSVSQTLIEVFPNIPVSVVRTAVTAGSLSALVIGLATGALVGRKLSYRFCAIFGLGCLCVGGIVPAFWYTNFWVIWVCRLLTGFGAAANRLSQPMIAFRVGSERQAAWFGYAGVITNVAAILMQNLAGKFAATQWNHIYYVNLFMLIPLLLAIFCLKEPEIKVQPQAEKKSGKNKLDARVIPYMLLLMWATLSLYPVFTSVSTVITAKGFGGVDVAAKVSSMYTFGVMLMSLVIGIMMKKLRRWTFTIGLVMTSVGLMMIMLAPSLTVVTIGTMIAGASYAPMSFSLNAFSSDVAAPENRAFSMIVVMAGASIAGFASSFWTSFVSKIFLPMLPFVSSDVECVSFINVVICMLIAIVTIFVDPSVPVRED